METHTRAEKEIIFHLKSANGLTNPVIASQQTGYAVSTCKRIFSKHANRELLNGDGIYHLIESPAN